MEVFTELGERVAQEWGRHRYLTEALPEIAAEALARNPLHRCVDYPCVLKWVGATGTLPYQENIKASFGEPPITVFWHPDFYIEALFWASSTTAVHGHGFVGAFQVLAGTSLQSLFEFNAIDPTNGKCRIGRLRQTDVCLLRPGDTQTILGAEQFIHSVFHLGYPSVTIVIRTHGRQVGEQHNYYRPGVALSYQYEKTFDQQTNRLLQVARLQAMVKMDDLRETVTRIGERGDLAACFRLLHTVQPILYGQQRLAAAGEVISALAATIGATRTTRLAEAVTLERDLGRLRRARLEVVRDDLRLFMALLLTQQARKFVLPLVSAYKDTPQANAAVAGWITELGAGKVLDVPSDKTAQDLLETWLVSGPDAALQQAQECPEPAEGIRKYTQLQAEPLLEPLLSVQH